MAETIITALAILMVTMSGGVLLITVLSGINGEDAGPDEHEEGV